MRRTIRAAVMAVAMMAAGAVAMRAQMIDPTTGVMVDAGTDPSDFAAVASGQPGNIGMELSAQATAQAIAQAQQFAEQAAATTNNLFPDQSNDDSVQSVSVPVVPATPKPTLTPNGGRFQGSVQVTIVDSSAEAAIFYTAKGKKPTTSSTQYLNPITVTAKEKVRAMAVIPGDRASGVVTKTFTVS
jgi:hypothetical protein